MKEIQFNRMNNYFFSFGYTIDEKMYSTGVLFTTPCPDEHFTKLLPTIKDNINWLEQNIDKLAIEIMKYLTEDSAIAFKGMYLVSFSLLFEGEAVVPKFNIAYGDDGVYLTALVENHKITSVEINE